MNQKTERVCEIRSANLGLFRVGALRCARSLYFRPSSWFAAFRSAGFANSTARSFAVAIALSALFAVAPSFAAAPAVAIPAAASSASPVVVSSASTMLATSARAGALFDVRKLSLEHYNGVVAAAMEGMRLVQEPMSEVDTKRFEAKWAALFNFPSAEAEAYLERLNPLLDEFLALRGAITIAASAVDEAWLEAKFAAGYEAEAATREAMAIVERQTSLLREARAQLASVLQKIAALGDPPDPVALHASARKRHDESVKLATQLIPMLSLAPERIVGAPNAPLRFLPRGRSLPPKASLSWNFGDGKTANGAVTSAQHAYAKEGSYVVEAVALDATGRPVARSRAEVQVSAKAAQARKGVWVLSAVRLRSPDRVDDWTIQRTLVEPEGRWDVESAGYEYDESSTGRRKHSGPMQIRARWKHPPVQGEPGALVELPWSLVATGNLVNSSILLKPTWSGTDAKVPNSEERGNAPTTPNYPNPGSGVCRFRFPQPLPHAPYAKFSLWVGCSFSFYSVGVKQTGGDRSYEYVFVPDGAEAEAIVAQATDPARRAAELARQQAVEEHRNNIAAIQRAIDSRRASLGGRHDDRDRALIDFSLRAAEAELQAERDRIESLETGRLVHTRTRWDEVAHAQFVGNIRQEQRRFGTLMSIMDRSERLIGLAPERERPRLREFARRQLSAKRVADGDLEAARRTLDAIGNQVQGLHQGEAAREEEKAAWADLGREAAENIKTAADAGMALTSLAGGQSIQLLYQAGTGFVEGGLTEAVKRGATTYSDAIDYAVTAYDGYQRGGFAEAGGDLAWKYVQDKALGWVVGKVTGTVQGKTAGAVQAKAAGKSAGPGSDLQSRRASVEEQLEAARFRKERAAGEARVREFQRAQVEIEAAARQGAPPEKIIELQSVARDKAAAVASSLHAKNYLKYKCDPHTGKAYDTHMRAIHADVDARVLQRMKDAGWNAEDWELREFRNASSYGRPNMDRDVGLREKPLWTTDENGRIVRDADGRPVPNPERWETRDGRLLLKPQLIKDKAPASLDAWQKDASAAYEQAYREVTGRSATAAMENVTTSAHPEAYKDLAWLGDDKTLVAAAWSSQAADVTRYKLHAPSHADPTSSYFTKMQEVSRGLAKDLETKLLPVLAAAKPQGSGAAALKVSERALGEMRRHWQKLQSVLAAYGRNEIDPVYASRRVRELTGGKSIPEMVDEMGTVLELTVKLSR